MRFLSDVPPPFELTYSDVFMVPSLSDVASRLDVDLSTEDAVGTTLPIVVANMTAVAGRRMAETIARRGGIAVLPQDVPVGILRDVVAYVKSRHPVYETPITLGPHDTIAEALALIHKRAHGVVVVVDADETPLGVFTEADAPRFDRFTQLQHVMSTDVLWVEDGSSPQDVFERLESARFTAVPVVRDGRLIGVMTRKGALRSSLYRPALDGDGRLMVAAAIGVNGDPGAKAEIALDAGADVLVIDTAHGHQAKTLQAVALTRKVAGTTPIVAGNVVTARGRDRPRRRRRRHRQGGRRSGRDVHHEDDDGRRPAPVLGRARVRRRGPPARPPRVGRRRHPPPARRRARRWPRARRASCSARGSPAPTRAPPTRCATPTAASTRRASAWRHTGP